jgi:homoserine dehydrogenase
MPLKKIAVLGLGKVGGVTAELLAGQQRTRRFRREPRIWATPPPSKPRSKAKTPCCPVCPLR